MAKAKSANPSEANKKMRPALSPEARENQLISLATDLAEQQLREGTASSQVISHFLKQSTAKAQLELEKMRLENELTKAKKENLESNKRMEELYENAIAAMREYSGNGSVDDDEEY